MTENRSGPPGATGGTAERRPAENNLRSDALSHQRPSSQTPQRSRREAKALARRQWQWIYDGRDLLAVVEERADGWHVLMHGRDDASATFPTREMAISFANARRANAPAAAIVGERLADAKRVNRIKMHQRAAEAQRARRTSHSQPRQRGRMTGSKEKLLPAGNKPEGTGSRVTTGQDGGRQP
jgi:Uncharacterized protein conserved in bacteria (DUF2188)